MSQDPTGRAGPSDGMEPPPLPPTDQPYVPQYLAYSSAMIYSYQSARPQARVVIGLLWVTIVVQLMLLWPSVSDLRDAHAAHAGKELSDELTSTDVITLVSCPVVYVPLTVFWMMWVHRTHRNLRSLGAEGLAYSPEWAVAYYFIPIVNLFRPFQVMRETWRASSCRHANGTQWMTSAAPALIGVWWALYLLWALDAVIIFVWAVVTADDPHFPPAIAWLSLFALFLEMALAVAGLRLVRALTEVQEARATELGLAKSLAPRPGAHGAPASANPE